MIATEPQRPDLTVGLDWGKKHDWTAVAVVHKDTPAPEGETGRRGWRPPHPTSDAHKPRYTVVQLDRIRQTSYTTVGWQIAQLMRRWELQRASVVADETGPGTGPNDILVGHGLDPWRISITAGLHVNKLDGLRSYGVPKRNLVHACEVVLEQGRLKTVADLPMADVLVKEMRNFKTKMSPSGHVTYGAVSDVLDWRDGEHDDLVLAVALAVWFAEDGPKPPELRPLSPSLRPSFRGLYAAGHDPADD